MFGLGGTEILIIVAVALVVFGGPAVIGFWLGYQAGRKAADTDSSLDSEPRKTADEAEETPPHE